jgi:hypothetical protein
MKSITNTIEFQSFVQKKFQINNKEIEIILEKNEKDNSYEEINLYKDVIFWTFGENLYKQYSFKGKVKQILFINFEKKEKCLAVLIYNQTDTIHVFNSFIFSIIQRIRRNFFDPLTIFNQKDLELKIWNVN